MTNSSAELFILARQKRFLLAQLRANGLVSRKLVQKNVLFAFALTQTRQGCARERQFVAVPQLAPECIGVRKIDGFAGQKRSRSRSQLVHRFPQRRHALTVAINASSFRSWSFIVSTIHGAGAVFASSSRSFAASSFCPLPSRA